METEDIDTTSRPPSVVDRYFQKRYKTDIQGKIGEDQLVLTHSNRICVICIAKSHPVFGTGKSVSTVSFEGDGWSRLDNTVTGKNKRGAQWLERSAPLCHVTCTDGSVFTLCCCVKGQLVEINTNLKGRPSLLTDKPSSDGYIAVILPGLKGFDREVEKLKSEAEYQEVLASRKKLTTSQHSEVLKVSATDPTDSEEGSKDLDTLETAQQVDVNEKESVLEARNKDQNIIEKLPNLEAETKPV